MIMVSRMKPMMVRMKWRRCISMVFLSCGDAIIISAQWREVNCRLGLSEPRGIDMGGTFEKRAHSRHVELSVHPPPPVPEKYDPGGFSKEGSNVEQHITSHQAGWNDITTHKMERKNTCKNKHTYTQDA
jgi:hypothetical protein